MSKTHHRKIESIWSKKNYFCQNSYENSTPKLDSNQKHTKDTPKLKNWISVFLNHHMVILFNSDLPIKSFDQKNQ